jgi:hypothetical protein
MLKAIIHIQTVNNVTLNYMDFRTFTRFNDANMHSLLIETSTYCPMQPDGRIKRFQFTNVYMTSDSREDKTAVHIEVFVD